MIVTKLIIGIIVASITNVIYLLLSNKIHIRFLELDEPMLVVVFLITLAAVFLCIPKIISEKIDILDLSKKLILNIKMIINLVLLVFGSIFAYKVYLLHFYLKKTVTDIYSGSILEIKRLFTVAEKMDWLAQIKKATNFDNTFWNSYNQQLNIEKIQNFSDATNSVKEHAETYYKPLKQSILELNQYIEQMASHISGYEKSTMAATIVHYSVLAIIAGVAIYGGYLGFQAISSYINSVSDEDLSFGRVVRDSFKTCANHAETFKKFLMLDWDITNLQIKVNDVIRSSLSIINRQNANIDLELLRLQDQITLVCQELKIFTDNSAALSCAQNKQIQLLSDTLKALSEEVIKHI